MIPYYLLAILIGGISAYRYSKATSVTPVAKKIVVSAIAVFTIIEWVFPRWGPGPMIGQFLVTLFVTIHLLLADDDSGIKAGDGRTTR